MFDEKWYPLFRTRKQCKMRTNSTTGLIETSHDRFKAPVVHQTCLKGLRLDGGHATAIHTVPLEQVNSLDFYARLAPAKILYISLQGAVTPGKVRYPNFPRVSSMRKHADAFMAIPDPTLQLSDDTAFGLAWYSGSEGWDPMDQIEEVVRRGMEHVGADSVVFLGGSGGGFAALRLSRRFPESLAFEMGPQVRIRDYNIRHQERLFSHCWPDWDRLDVMDRYPERFDLHELYANDEVVNYIYYRQSTLDHHLEDHAQPLLRALRSKRAFLEGRYLFSFEEGAKPGHGSITDEEFLRHLSAAREHWRLKIG